MKKGAKGSGKLILFTAALAAGAPMVDIINHQ